MKSKIFKSTIWLVLDLSAATEHRKTQHMGRSSHSLRKITTVIMKFEV